MDNLTHTLVGVLVGEATAHTVEHRSGLDPSRRRNLLVTMLAVGSNAPDFDLLISGGKLDYLLHHRGHTHTFVAALLTALLIYLFCELWIRLRKLRATAADRRCLALAALLGPVLHIFMDMTNNYGVHPWWPFDNRWLYGDAVWCRSLMRSPSRRLRPSCCSSPAAPRREAGSRSASECGSL
jgi:inner membrane protein